MLSKPDKDIHLAAATSLQNSTPTISLSLHDILFLNVAMSIIECQCSGEAAY